MILVFRVEVGVHTTMGHVGHALSLVELAHRVTSFSDPASYILEDPATLFRQQDLKGNISALSLEASGCHEFTNHVHTVLYIRSILLYKSSSHSGGSLGRLKEARTDEVFAELYFLFNGLRKTEHFDFK